MRLLLVATMASFLLAAARSASASPAARLVYGRSPQVDTCPDEPALRKAVAARVGYDPFFPWAKTTIVVQIWRDAHKLAGRVQLVDDSGVARGTRELSSSAEDCVELFDATALAISIALDAAPDEPATPPHEEPTPPPAPEPTKDLPSVEPPFAPVETPPRDEPERVKYFIGADVLASNGTGPSTSAGGAGFLQARLSTASIEVNLRAELPSSTHVGASDISTWLFAASIVPCAHFDTASICAIAMIGSMQGGDGQSPRGALIGALGGRAGLGWAIAPSISMRFHADLLGDLAPPTFAVGSDTWTAPGVVFGAGIGVLTPFL